MTDFNQVDILSGEIAPLPPNFRDALNGKGYPRSTERALSEADHFCSERAEIDALRRDMQATQDIADKYAAEADRFDQENVGLRCRIQELEAELSARGGAA